MADVLYAYLNQERLLTFKKGSNVKMIIKTDLKSAENLLLSTGSIIMKFQPQETIDLDVANNPCSKLYRHILKSETYRNETFKMKKIAMSFTATEDKTPWEFALVSQFPMNDNSARRIGDYEASTLVTHDHPQADENPKKGKLDLSFFVILVNKEQYPDRYPHAKASQSDNNLQEHFDSQTSMKQSNSKQIQMYLTKWTNGPGIARSQERRAYGMLDTYMNQPLSPATIRGQHPAYSLLIDQSKVVKSKLVNLVHAASLQFRGDSLWQQIVSPVRKKRSSNTDVFPYDETTKLTFTEFDELLQTVPKETLNQHGSLVQVLDMMPHSWFASFTKVLAAKYDDMYKEFISPDGQLVHSVLLMPDVDDAILLMSIYYDSKKTKLQILYKDEPTASDFDKRKALLGFYNTLCFHMWAQMAS